MLPSLISSFTSSASRFAVSTRVSSVDCRTPGLTSFMTILMRKYAPRPTIKKYPRKTRRPMVTVNLSVVLEAVAQAAMGPDGVAVRRDRPQLGAQGFHVGVDGAVQA